MTLHKGSSHPSDPIHPRTADERPTAAAARLSDAGPRSAAQAMCDRIRTEMTTDIGAIAHHVLSGGGQIDDQTASVLRRLEAGEILGLDELIAAHDNLSAIIAPATPRAICALQESERSTGLFRFLGPTPAVRRLTMANLFFALLFFGLSVSPRINEQTVSLSIYEQSGLDLVIKLLFLMSAAGLGASFGALFEVWQEIREGRFDPISESTHWMRITLGLVSGLVLSELVRTGPATAADQTSSVIAEPLLALVGGFSARLVHLVVTRIVTSIEHTFEPPGMRRQAGPRPMRERLPGAAGATRPAEPAAGGETGKPPAAMIPAPDQPPREGPA